MPIRTGGRVAVTDHNAGDETQIRSVLQGRADAMRARDASQFLASFDPAIVKFDMAPPLQELGEAVLDPAGLQAWLDTWQDDIEYVIAKLTIAVADDVAFCHSLNHLHGTRTDGEREDMWTRSTLGLRKNDGVWKIVHEHHSVPIYMDGSNRPAFDLQP
jgi:ketosteroid isomerase-like protein